jgi:hypothetical protein
VPEKPKQARSDIDAFLTRTRELQVAKRQQGPAMGRLIFALDATMSRQSSWDKAAELQHLMFQEARNLELQLVYYRGQDECKATGWIESGGKLGSLMSTVKCRAGVTQLDRVRKPKSRSGQRQ